MSISEVGVGILDTHVTWNDIEEAIQKKFGSSAKFGPNKRVKLMGEMMGFFSRMCLIHPDWQGENTERLPQKFLVKVMSSLTRMEMNDAQEDLTYLDNKEASELLDNHLMQFHNTECHMYKLIEKYGQGRIPVPEIYGSQEFTEENPSKGFILMEFVENVADIHPTDKINVEQVKQILRIVAALQAVSFKITEEERHLFCKDIYSSFVGPFFGLMSQGFLNDLKNIGGGHFANKIEELEIFVGKLLGSENSKKLDNYTEEQGMPKIITHDDVWLPNTLWTKSKEDGQLKFRALLDFQTASLNSPAADLVNILCANLNGEDRRSHGEELIETFYGYMEEELQGNVPYTLEQLKLSCKKFFPICGFETFQCGTSFVEHAKKTKTDEEYNLCLENLSMLLEDLLNSDLS